MFRAVWLLRNLSLDGEFFLRDSKNAAFLYKTSSPSLAVAGKPEKRYAMPAHKPQDFSDWINPHSFGNISAFGSMANLA